MGLKTIVLDYLTQRSLRQRWAGGCNRFAVARTASLVARSVKSRFRDVGLQDVTHRKLQKQFD